MPLIGWNNSYRVGVRLFDLEHRQLLRQINDFYDTALTGWSLDEHRLALAALITCAQKHFAHEEEYFDICRYSGGEGHRAEHIRLMRELEAFRADFLDGRYTCRPASDLSVWFVIWFGEHIKNEDRNFCAVLRRIGVS